MNRRGEKERGFALLLALLVVLLLVVLIFETDFQVRTDLQAAGNFRDDSAAYYLALSGISAGKAILKDDLEGTTTPGSNTSDYEQELWAFPIPEYPLGEGTLAGQIKDESAKFNLNSLVIKNPSQEDKVALVKKEQLTRLLERLDLGTEDIVRPMVDSMIDWIDADDRRGDYGAEDETYRSLIPPYSAKNDRFDTLEEILYVHGMDLELYKKISPYLTVYPKTTVSQGNPNTANALGTINVNTADSLILLSIHGSMNEDDAKKIIDHRPYSSVEDFKKQLPAEVNQWIADKALTGSFAVTSNIFSIEAYGTVRDTRKNIRAIWDRQNKKLLYLKVE